MIRCTKATCQICQKCHHPPSCEGHMGSGIMGNNIQSCAHLPPCYLMEGRAVGTSEKMTAKKKKTKNKSNRKKYSSLQNTLSSATSKNSFKWHFFPLMGSWEAVLAENALAVSSVFIIIWLNYTKVTDFKKKPLTHWKFWFHIEGSRLAFHP